MGILDRFRPEEEEHWIPPVRGSCLCTEHVEQLVEVVIPTSRTVDYPSAQRAEDLASDITVTPYAEAEQHVPGLLPGERMGPFHWKVEYGDLVRSTFDAHAPASLDDVVFVHLGVDRVLWPQKAFFSLGAPKLCPSGVKAALVNSLRNDRVRLPVV